MVPVNICYSINQEVLLVRPKLFIDNISNASLRDLEELVQINLYKVSKYQKSWIVHFNAQNHIMNKPTEIHSIVQNECEEKLKSVFHGRYSTVQLTRWALMT